MNGAGTSRRRTKCGITKRCTPSRRVGFFEVDDRSRRPGDRKRSAQDPMSRKSTIFIVLSAVVFITYVAYDYFNRPRFVGGVVAIHTGTPPDHGLLGVTFGLPPNEMILTGVLEGGPAWDAGIEVGDHLIGIGGERTDTVQHFLSVIRDTSPGDVVAIQFQRGGHENDVDVVLCDVLTIRELNLDRRLLEGSLVPVSEP